MKEIREIKGLQSQLSKAQGDAAALKLDIANKQREHNQKLEVIRGLKAKISSISNNKNVRVSEHALIRYFERVKGFNTEDIEKEILSADILKMIETLGGSGTFPNANGYQLLMKDYTVTTIIV